MANTFIEIIDIARQALPRLIENLVMPNLIHRDYDNVISDKGAKFQVKKPVKLTATKFVDSAGVTAQAVTESSVEVELDTIADVSVEWTAIQSVTNIDDLNRLFIEPAMVTLAETINADGMALYKDIPYVSGAVNAIPDDLTDFSAAMLLLNNNKVPVSPRNAIWSPDAHAAFSTIAGVVNAEKSGSTAALREGSIGRVMGFENYMSQSVPTHTCGITTQTTVVTSADVAAGALKVSISASSLVGTAKKGDLITVNGIMHTVTKDSAAASSNAIANIEVYPPLAASSAGVTVTFTASHKANIFFHPQAFAFVTRPLVKPSNFESYVTSYNGVSMRLVKGYDMKYKKEMLSMDVLYTFKTMYPELAGRYMGKI